MSPGPADDLLPVATAPDRVARRRARQIRRAAIAGAVAGAVVLVIVLVAVFGGDEGSSPRAETRAARRRSLTTSTSAVLRTTTTSLGDTDTTTSTPADDGTGSGSGSGGSAPPATASPGTTPPDTGSDGGVSVSEDRGACAFDSSTDELVDAGTLGNAGAEEATAEVQVTWSDDTGELDSWSDVQSVPPGGSTAWSVSTAWPEPVQGDLRCEIMLL